MDLGQRIRSLREERKMGLADFAQRLGLSVDDARAVESGDRQVSHEEIQALTQVLDVSIDDLFAGSQSGEVPTDNEGQSVLIPQDRLSALLDEMKEK